MAAAKPGQDALLPPDIHALPPAAALSPSDAMIQLLPQQRESYATQGYCLCPGLIDPATTRALQQAVDEMLDSAAGMPRVQTEMFDFEESHTPDLALPRVRRIKRPDRHSDPFRQLLRDPRLMGVVAQILGPDVRHQNIKLNIKAGKYGSPVEWHQVRIERRGEVLPRAVGKYCSAGE